MKLTHATRRSQSTAATRRGQTARHALTASIALAGAFFLGPCGTQAVLIDDTFILGADGLWSVPGNWDNGVPNNGGGNTYNVFIDSNAGTNVKVSLNIDAMIDGLTVDVGDELAILNNHSLTVFGTTTNNGVISLNSAGNNTVLSVTTLDGTGILKLGAGNNTLTSSGVLANGADHTISGGGSVGVNSVSIVNLGTIDANLPAAIMNIDPANGGGLQQLRHDAGLERRHPAVHRQRRRRLQQHCDGRDPGAERLGSAAGECGHDHGWHPRHRRHGSDRRRRQR